MFGGLKFRKMSDHKRVWLSLDFDVRGHTISHGTCQPFFLPQCAVLLVLLVKKKKKKNRPLKTLFFFMKVVLTTFRFIAANQIHTTKKERNKEVETSELN